MFFPLGPAAEKLPSRSGNLGTVFPTIAPSMRWLLCAESNEDRVKETDSQDQGSREYCIAGGKSENEQ